MPRRAATVLVYFLALLAALATSCVPGPQPGIPQPQPSPATEVAVVASTPAVAVDPAGEPSEEAFDEPPVEDGAPGPIPVTRADPVRGRWNAPVTLVVFSDLECPFCKRVHGTINQLRGIYGPDKLRVVWKNNPLPFHKNARPAAEAAMAAFAYQGPAAFWAFHDAIFDSPDRLSPELEESALRKAGVDPMGLHRLLESGAAQRKVDADIELGKQLGVTGTPASFINGVFLSGSQPVEKFQEIIDAQLEAARGLRDAGVPPSRVYASLAQKNYEARPKQAATPASAKPDPDDTIVHRVPIGDSPVKGKATALVTLVMFSEYQCPFCSRVEPTIDQLVTKYGDDLRVVWKHNPLPFHPRAEPAAQLAIEARAQKGDAIFWKITDELFANQKNLDDAALEAIAAGLKLNVAAVKKAIETHKHKLKIEVDQDLADDLEARGTPSFFINGRRLVGAQPIDRFEKIIDEEIARAKELVAKGTARAKVYDAIQKSAVGPTPPTKVSVPAPGKGQPAKGAAGGKVVIQVFGDFQCPFCARAAKTVDEVVAAFPGKVKVVWRNLPLTFHAEAQLAAEAALEARAQQGDVGFWKMHDLLYQDTTTQNLDRAALERHARSLGLDMAKFTAALDTRAHQAAVEADKKIAEAAKISATPTFVINGYMLSGAQPLSKFKKAVKLALSEVK